MKKPRVCDKASGAYPQPWCRTCPSGTSCSGAGVTARTSPLVLRSGDPESWGLPEHGTVCAGASPIRRRYLLTTRLAPDPILPRGLGPVAKRHGPRGLPGMPEHRYSACSGAWPEHPRAPVPASPPEHARAPVRPCRDCPNIRVLRCNP